MEKVSGQITIIDYNDTMYMSSYLTANIAQTQLYDPDLEIYAPDWTVSPYLIITASLYKPGETENLITSEYVTDVTFYEFVNGVKTEIVASATRVISGVNNHILTIKANELEDLDAKDYICKISYTDSETDAVVECSLSFMKVTLSQVGDDIYRSDEEPLVKTVGMLWFNTSNGSLQMWDGNDWILQDLSQFITESAVDDKLVTKNRTWITEPVPPYYAGDIWTVQEGADKGKIKTCLTTRLTGVYTDSDWFTPLDAYTTVTQMTNVIGTDPNEWSSTSSSLTQLINENTNEIAGAVEQAARLAVRASDIEMSFSRTGTMNFLGNSSCQNEFEGWTMSTSSLFSQIRDSDLVAGYGFRMYGNYSHMDSIRSGLTVPPAGDFFTVSIKLKNQSPYSYIFFEAVPFDDNNNRLDNGSSDNTGWVRKVPYTTEASSQYVLFHFVADKRIITGLKKIKIAMFFCKVSLDTSITTRPTWNDSYINKLIKEGSTYYYGASSYTKMNIVVSNEVPQQLASNEIWKCSSNIYDSNNTLLYIAGFYYYKDYTGNLVPVVDNYDITMLDSDTYYKIVGTGWEDVTSRVSDDVLQPDLGPVYFGDIMFNGGQMVQTWTPRQDENLWGTNIKFNEHGITLKSSTRKRQLNETSDIAWNIDSSTGQVLSCIWTLTDNGFITNNIKCYGSFYMGDVPSNSFDESSMDTYFNNHKVLEMAKANDTAGKGINEYIYN